MSVITNVSILCTICARSGSKGLKNKNIINGVVAAVVIIVAGYLFYKNYYLSDKIIEAQNAIWRGEQYFAVDSFRLALEGDANNFDGFEWVAEEYSMTPSGNLANYYAGICNLHLGRYEEAIEYLKSYDADDVLLEPVALGAIGDANSELQNYEEALKYYEKAFHIENEFTTPIYLMKAGLIYEQQGAHSKALALYKKIKSKYPNSEEGRNIDKYITKAETLAQN